METGDSVEIGNGIRRLVVDSRDEIIPCSGGFGTKNGAYRLQTVYRLAGEEYSSEWFTREEVSLFSKRR